MYGDAHIKPQRRTNTGAAIKNPATMQQSDHWHQHPVFVLFFLVGFIFIAEVCIALLIDRWPATFAYLNINSFHALILTLLVLPVLYLLVLRPQAKLLHERLLLRNSLQASRENFQSIVTKSTDGILVLNQEGIIQYVNSAAEQLLHKSSQDLLGILFGFTASAGEVTEIDFLRENQQIGTSEMRVQQTDWHGTPAMLVSLRDISETVSMREQLREQSLTDELTGLNNRRSFLLLAEQQIRLATRSQFEIFIIFMDLDRFKQINDTLGHKVGDQVLVDIANILNQVFRGSDIVSRFGGDEFVVLTIDADKDGMSTVTARLQKVITDHNKDAGRPYQILISYGLARYDVDHPTPLADLIESADRRMYEQKQAKKAGNA